jgi:hypothetical protein
MCSLCGAIGRGQAWEQEGTAGGDVRWRRQREATATAVALTAMLLPRRIKITASPDFGFVVAFPTGGTEMVDSLAQVWHLLSRRSIEIPDPLAV